MRRERRKARGWAPLKKTSLPGMHGEKKGARIYPAPVLLLFPYFHLLGEFFF